MKSSLVRVKGDPDPPGLELLHAKELHQYLVFQLGRTRRTRRGPGPKCIGVGGSTSWSISSAGGGVPQRGDIQDQVGRGRDYSKILV